MPIGLLLLCSIAQYGRDTIALTGAAYLMDAVEYAMKSIRGTDKDPGNKMMGGVAAGGLLGVMCKCAGQQGTGRASDIAHNFAGVDGRQSRIATAGSLQDLSSCVLRSAVYVSRTFLCLL